MRRRYRSNLRRFSVLVGSPLRKHNKLIICGQLCESIEIDKTLSNIGTVQFT